MHYIQQDDFVKNDDFFIINAWLPPTAADILYFQSMTTKTFQIHRIFRNSARNCFICFVNFGTICKFSDNFRHKLTKFYHIFVNFCKFCACGEHFRLYGTDILNLSNFSGTFACKMESLMIF